MAEIISIRVNVNDGDYKRTTGRLLEIQKYVETLNKTPVHIKIDDTGFEKATKQITAYNNSVARMVKAENELAVAKEKTAQAQAKAEAEAWKAEQQETRLATAQVNRHTQTIRQQTEIIKGENQIALQKEKTATVVARTAQEEAKANTALVQGQARLAVQQEKTATAAARAEAAQREQNAAMQEGSAASSLLNNSLGSLVLQYVSIRAIISKVVSAFRDALNTMKEVDSELVTIQKTTGYSGEQLDRLTESAYNLASAYGRTATEILNAASVFARAGFKDNLDDMTELSALLQNVGDLSGEAAAKFLIATNAAWKLDGSYQDLMEVIDGLNAQTNQAAVDMEALTSGITVAGSVFSNAGETVQTFAGLLGAGVALTQRSGSEIARGLRTIAMNIRQIKGELDDGEIIDEESISDAAAALHSVGISVADANGELRLTSDVLSELAGRWGTLTTAEQSYLSQSLAGKRQANILNALMNNWEEAQRQMALYANGAGSALQENEIYLDSWEAKTKQLDAAWTEFVANLVETDVIKRAMDGLIALVNLLDSDFGHFLVTATAITTGLLTLGTVLSKLQAAFAMLSVTMAPVLGVAAVGVGIAGLIALSDALTTSAQEYADAVKEAEDAYARTQNQIEDLKRRESELTDIERQKLKILQEQEKIQAEQVRKAKVDQYNNLYGNGTANQTASDMIRQSQAYQRRLEMTTDPKEFEKLEKGLDNVNSRILTMYSDLLDFKEALGTLPEDGEEAIRTLQAFAGVSVEAVDDTKDALAELLAEVKRLGIDINKTVFGNIDTNNRQVIEWTQANLEKYKKEIQSWGYEIEDLFGTISTVMGTSNEYDGVEIAFSPILQTADGPVLLSEDTVNKYIFGLISKAGEGWTSEELFHLDTQGLEIDGIKISNLIADIGASAIKTGEAMHYVGQYGALALAGFKQPIEEAAEKTQTLEERLEAASKKASSYDTVISAATSTMSDFGAESYEVYHAMENLESIIPGSTDKLYDFDTATLLVNADIFESKEALLDFIDAQKQVEFSQQISELEALAAGYLEVAGAALEAMSSQQAQAQMSAVLGFTTGSNMSAAAGDASKRLDEIKQQREEWNAAIAALRARTGYRKQDKDLGGGSSYSRSTEDRDTGTVTDKELELLEAVVSLRKSELSFLEASGAAEDERISKMREEQEALHKQAEYMRGILRQMEEQGSGKAELAEYQAKINGLSTEWWNIQGNINKLLEQAAEQMKEIGDEAGNVTRGAVSYTDGYVRTDRDLVDVYMEKLYASGLLDDERERAQSQMDAAVARAGKNLAQYVAQAELLEEANASADELAAQYRLIQGELQKQIAEMERLGYSREEILEVTKQYYEYENKISALLEKEKSNREALFDSLKSAIDDYYDRIVSDKEQELSLEEKILAVREAEAALENAQNERTVRIFNRASGQWEWVADAKEVQSAKERLEDAQKALSDYQKDLARSEFKDAWEYVSEQLKSGAITFQEAYAYMAMKTKLIADEYGVDLSAALEDGMGSFRALGITVYSLTEELTEQLKAAIGKMTEGEGSAFYEMVQAFMNVRIAVNNGSMSIDEAFRQLRETAILISEKYGVDMTAALDAAIAAMNGTVSGGLEALWQSFTGITGITGGGSTGTGGGSGSTGIPKTKDEALAMARDAYTEDQPWYWANLVQNKDARAKNYSVFTDLEGNEIMRAGAEPGIRNSRFAGLRYDPLGEAVEYEANWIRRAEEADRNGDTKTVNWLLNALFMSRDSSGHYASIDNGEGVPPSGLLQAMDENAHGEELAVLNGQLWHTQVNPGTKLLDAQGRVWTVGADGQSLTHTGFQYWDTTETDMNAMDWYTGKQNERLAELSDEERAAFLAGVPGFDSGGILRGRGGIKATEFDEFILPPDLTRQVLDPMNNERSRLGLETLGNLLGVASILPQPVDRSIGTQNNGNVYNLGGVSIGENEARTMTVFELARLAGSLGINQGGN